MPKLQHNDDQRTTNSSLIPDSIENTDAVMSKKKEESSEEDITFHEVPEYQKELVAVDCMIRTVPGDGACLFNCAALVLYGIVEKMNNL